MSDRLTRLLEWLEERADPAHHEAVRSLAGQAMAFEVAPRLPLRVMAPPPPEIDFRPYPYSEAFEDPEKMLYNELGQHAASALIGDDRCWAIRANFGVGIIPSAFGRPCRILNDSMPWVEPAETPGAIRRIVEAETPADNAGLLGRCWSAYAHFLDRLEPYPRLAEVVRPYHPDFQGPFDAAHLIWGHNLYTAMRDDPALVHELLDRVTTLYVRAMRRYKKLVGEGCDLSPHWSMWHCGGVLLRCDTATCISRRMYDAFILPYDERLLAEFGGGMHYCGSGKQFFPSLIEAYGLTGINFGEPERQDLDLVLEATQPLGIGMIGLPAASMTPGRRDRWRTGIYLTTDAPDVDTGRRLMAGHTA